MTARRHWNCFLPASQQLHHANTTTMESTRSKLPTSNKYPARLHATKVFRELYKRLGGAAAQARGEESKLVLYLEGSQIKYRDDTDRELPFR